jgi:hypothetical protein
MTIFDSLSGCGWAFRRDIDDGKSAAAALFAVL